MSLALRTQSTLSVWRTHWTGEVHRAGSGPEDLDYSIVCPASLHFHAAQVVFVRHVEVHSSVEVPNHLQRLRGVAASRGGVRHPLVGV